jgi:pilus assembly protein CpaC
MLRILAWTVCASLITASPLLAQLAPVPPQQPPRPLQDANVQSASAGEPSADKLSAQQALLKQKIAERDRLQAEIDRLQQASGIAQQFLVRIQVVEVSRTKMRKLGVDYAVAGEQAVFNAEVADLVDTLIRPSKDNLGFHMLEHPDSLRGLISALQKNNIAKVLAEPNIVVANGRPASFHVGREFPLPVAPDTTASDTTQKDGTQVDILAVLLGGNKVRMDLRVRVGEADFSREINSGGVLTPFVSVCQVDTAINVPIGQTAVLSGMIQERPQTATSAGNKSVPEEVELLFLVTPELVSPRVATQSGR